jgi:hypothetical protein
MRKDLRNLLKKYRKDDKYFASLTHFSKPAQKNRFFCCIYVLQISIIREQLKEKTIRGLNRILKLLTT